MARSGRVAGGVLALVAWSGLLVAALVALHALGSGPLGGPPAGVAWHVWLSGHDPLLAVAAIGRLVVLVVGWYLAVTTVLGAGARLVRSARAVRMADALTVPFVRGLLQRALGIGLATAVTLSGMSTVPAGADPGERRPPPLVELDGSRRDLVLDEATGPPLPPTLGLLDRPDRGGAVDRVGPAVPAHDRHEVQPGESFWSIAVAALTAAWGRAPTDREVVPYWQELIAANRAELVDPDDPDLIHPGQRFRLPPTPPVPG